jgi:hypothetical protein
MRVPVMRSVGLVTGAVVLALVGTTQAGAAPGGSRTIDTARTPSPQAHGQLGRWTVSPVGSGAYRLTWHSPTRLPITDAPVQVSHGGAVVAATVGRHSRTASVVVSSATPPDTSTYDVVRGTQVLDRRGTESKVGPDIAPYVRPSTRSLAPATDSGAPGTHAIRTSDYALDPVKLPGIPQLSEMVGHVVAPADATDASPLVLFLHGRHDICYRPPKGGGPGIAFPTGDHVWSCPAGELPIPSYLGYDYVQRTLASQGYVTVSISADAINALDFRDADGGAQARAALIQDHLRAWVGFVADGTHPADLSDVVLVGHSRGGEGVNRASLDLPTDEGYAVTGQVLIGPTDFAFQAAPATPTVTILPYCDGDVSDLQGQNFTDDGRDITADPAADLAFHSSILVMGANHNFFNSEWTPGIAAAPSFDDWFSPPHSTCGTQSANRLSAGQQRKVGRAYIAGAVHLFADGDTSALPLFDGSAVSVPSAGNADVRSHALGGGMVTFRPAVDGTVGAGATADVRLCTGISDSDDPTACQQHASSGRAPHWPSAFFTGVPVRQFLQVGWNAVGQQGGLDLSAPADLSGDSRLDLRTIVDPRVGPVQVGVSITDAGGNTAVLTPVGGGNLDPLPSGSFSLSKRWGQDLRVSLADATGVDLTQVAEIGLVSRNASGRVFLVDLSATPVGGPSADPTPAVPVFSIGTVQQQEGNGTAKVTVDVPWTVTGDLQQPAVVHIVHSTPFSFGGSVATDTLTIPAHTTSGVLPITYKPNDLDDIGKRLLGRTAYAVSGIETDQYIGGASIIDDDPTPGLTVQTKAHRITAGQRATWKVVLDKPVHYFAFALLRPVKAVDGPQLRIGDLTKKFRKRFVGTGFDNDLPLYKSGIRFFVEIRQGRRSGSFSLPTRPEHGVTRAISLRFRAPHFQLAKPVHTVKVAPAG